MRIALIGQAPFGAAIFERLVADGHEIVGVFTPPEREGGRPDPLAQATRDAGITLVQPRRWQRRRVVDEEVIAQYEATKPELNVMAFVTQIIPSRVLEFPPLKTIQYHPSILPKHRGRSAINHAIVQGDTMTGVTIFWVDEGLDTGPILLQRSCPIGPDATINDVYREYLFPLGVETMAEAVQLVEAGQAPRHVQNEDDMTYEGSMGRRHRADRLVARRADGTQLHPRLGSCARGLERGRRSTRDTSGLHALGPFRRRRWRGCVH